MVKFQPPVVSFRLGLNPWLWMIILDSSKPIIVEEDAYDHQFQRLDLRFLGNLTLARNSLLDQRFSMANPTPPCLFGSPTSDAPVVRRNDEYLVEEGLSMGFKPQEPCGEILTTFG
ncbi:hypothetical protein J1N35_034563 [Gossypium stocksii]|uniref:Uncharacterized protein n=1 Tax=Gossypium stocksii TaxID=47602 RepID=A0A9D3ZQ98_9ROSI|nr:hypothetical protein J1N35_034563 [Gossypium stocksii]